VNVSANERLKRVYHHESRPDLLAQRGFE